MFRNRIWIQLHTDLAGSFWSQAGHNLHIAVQVRIGKNNVVEGGQGLVGYHGRVEIEVDIGMVAHL